MVKLSQQLQSADGSIRLTRTQRELIRKKQKDKREYDTFKKKAEEVQRDKFSNITSIEQYEKEYSKLEPGVQSFFQSPSKLRQDQDQQKQEVKTDLQSREEYAKEQLSKEKTRYEKAKQDYQSSRDKLKEQRDKYDRGSDWYREELQDRKERLRSAKDDYEEQRKYWKEYQKGIGEGIRRLDQGQVVGYKDVLDYSQKLAKGQKERQQQINKRQELEYQQRQKVENLISKGYSPYTVTEYKDGKEQTITIGYSKEGADKPFVQLEEFETSPKVDVTDLEESQFGKIPLTRKIKYGGREFDVSDEFQLYKKGDQGELVTRYGEIGFTEQELIDKQRKLTLESETERLKGSPTIEGGFVVLDQEDLPAGYGGRTSVSSQPTNVLMSEVDYYRQQDKPTVLQNVLSDSNIIGGIKKVWDKIPEGQWSFGKTIKFQKELFDESSKRIKGWATEDQDTEQREEDLAENVQDVYQREFERQQLKSIIYEEKTFDEAVEEFEKSDTAYLIQKRYEEQYKDLQADINKNIKLGRKGLGYLGAGTFSLTSNVLGAVETPKKAVLTTGLVYGGVKTLKALPTFANIGIGGTFFTSGVKRVISPTSSFEEASSGFVTALISGGSLAYSGYRYLRQPKLLPREKIPVKLKEISNKAIGLEDPTKVLIKQYGKFYSVSRVNFPAQKLSRQVIAGSRQPVTSQGRLLLNKQLNRVGLNLKNLYEGVPYVDPKGYTKVFKRFTKYGYTESQARRVLRYQAPRVIDTSIERGSILTTTTEGKAISTGEFNIVTKQPRILVDQKLGIKTRYARTMKDIYSFERYPTTLKGKDYIFTNIEKYSPYALPGKTTTTFTDLSRVKLGETQKGVIPIAQQDGLDVLGGVRYQDIQSYFAQRQIIPIQRSLRFGTTQTRLIKPGTSRVVEVDLDKMTGFTKTDNIYYGGTTKTSFSKTFGLSDEIKNIVKKGGSVTGKDSLNNLKEVIRKIDNVKPSGSVYAGTGQYERTVGGFSPASFQQVTIPQITPTTTSTSIRNIIRGQQGNIFNVKTGVIAGVGSSLKIDQSTGLDTKLNTQLKNMLRGKLDTGLKQDLGLKQSVAQKTSLKQLTTTTSLGINLLTPTFASPPIPPTKFTPTPSIRFDLPKQLLKKKVRAKKDDKIDYGYLPDFTARAIGLQPQTVSEKQAQKKLKKILTGLEVRRPVKVKW